MPRTKKAAEETAPVAAPEGVVRETSETPTIAPTVPPTETKGRFSFSHTPEGYQITDDSNRPISHGTDVSEGKKLFDDLTKR